ncbi:MAG: hypothetical protein FE78DRAFT_74245 [Acidomyces sp. 'richmondensis']|nr:MAG: hypothetical protein FE78DRAFT_74245 [Acidomyces sp. 'richmondensis']
MGPPLGPTISDETLQSRWRRLSRAMDRLSVASQTTTISTVRQSAAFLSRNYGVQGNAVGNGAQRPSHESEGGVFAAASTRQPPSNGRKARNLGRACAESIDMDIIQGGSETLSGRRGGRAQRRELVVLVGICCSSILVSVNFSTSNRMVEKPSDPAFPDVSAEENLSRVRPSRYGWPNYLLLCTQTRERRPRGRSVQSRFRAVRKFFYGSTPTVWSYGARSRRTNEGPHECTMPPQLFASSSHLQNISTTCSPSMKDIV